MRPLWRDSLTRSNKIWLWMIATVTVSSVHATFLVPWSSRCCWDTTSVSFAALSSPSSTASWNHHHRPPETPKIRFHFLSNYHNDHHEEGAKLLTRVSTLEGLFHLTNVERTRLGLAALGYSRELSQAAQHHAEDMQRFGYFSHTGLMDGSSAADRVQTLTNYRYTMVGENLYMQSPENHLMNVLKGWMDSPRHRENILNPEFREIGLGYQYHSGQHYYVQVFACPLSTPSVQGLDNTCDSLLELTNHARVQANLHPLQISDTLQTAAQRHAEAMLVTTDGARVVENIIDIEHRANKDQFRRMAVHCARSEPFNDPYGIFLDWFQGEGNDGRYVANMLDDCFTDVGLGYATDGKRHYYIQLFGAQY